MKSRGTALRNALDRLGFVSTIIVKNDERGTSWTRNELTGEDYEQAAAEYDKGVRAELPEDIEAFLQEVEARANKARKGPIESIGTKVEYGFSTIGIRPQAGKDIRARMDDATGNDITFMRHAFSDVPRLVAIVQMQQQQMGIECELCGWAMKFPNEPCRCELAKERAHWRRATGCLDPATIEIALGRLYGLAECKPPPDGISDGIARIKKERDQLRADNAALSVREAQFAEQVVASAAREKELRERRAKLEAALAYAATQLEVANELLFGEGIRDEDEGVSEIREWIHETRTGLLNEKGGVT